jgi:hypothetical protein
MRLEFEGILRVLFADQGDLEQLERSIKTITEQARTGRAQLAAMAKATWNPAVNSRNAYTSAPSSTTTTKSYPGPTRPLRVSGPGTTPQQQQPPERGRRKGSRRRCRAGPSAGGPLAGRGCSGGEAC